MSTYIKWVPVGHTTSTLETHVAGTDGHPAACHTVPYSKKIEGWRRWNSQDMVPIVVRSGDLRQPGLQGGSGMSATDELSLAEQVRFRTTDLIHRVDHDMLDDKLGSVTVCGQLVPADADRWVPDNATGSLECKTC